MKKIFWTGLTIGLLLTGIISPANATSFSYSFTVNGGTPVALTPLSGPQTANEYYYYYAFSGHPLFGTEKSTAFFWLWQDTTANLLSLNVIFNKPEVGGTWGKAWFSLSGLPPGWSWTLRDDFDSIDSTTDINPTWGWASTFTDGGVIGGLENSAWDILWTPVSTPNNFYGITNWYFLSAGTSKLGQGFSFSPNSTLTVSAAPVPEPTSLLLMSAGLIGLVGARPKKKN